MSDFNLQRYLNDGVENVMAGMLKATRSHPRMSLAMLQFATEAKRASKLRHKSEEEGRHIPPFLIASIADSCNLHCKGCYARENRICCDGQQEASAGRKALRSTPLTAHRWDSIFSQAADLGISFILLAGGEPLMRNDVLKIAASNKQILFPVFTNGTLMNVEMLDFFEKHRNLIPILSLEGGEEATDARRGAGVYQMLRETMERLKKRQILYGASITVHRKNITEVMSQTFTAELENAGCRGVIYVEYVPVGSSGKGSLAECAGSDSQKSDVQLAPTEEDRQNMMTALTSLRNDQPEMLFVAFPGDEMASGGCLAAGRGFFHINPYGDAEPCPFSPYSGGNLAEISLEEALHNSLFSELRQSGILEGDHAGGCVLFSKEEQVRALAGGK